MSDNSWGTGDMSLELRRFLIRCAAFGSVLGVILAGLEVIAPVGWGNAVLARKMRQLGGKQNSDVATIFVGSSRVYRQIDPVLFDRIAGLSGAYNLGSPGSDLLAHLQVIEDLLRRRKERPRRIFLELQAVPFIAEENLHAFGSFYAHDVRRVRLAVGYWWRRGDGRQCRHHLRAGVDNLVKLGAYREVLGELLARLRHTAAATDKDRGFVPLVDSGGLTPQLATRRRQLLESPRNVDLRKWKCREERKVQSRESISDADLWLAREINNLGRKCQEMGIELIVFIPPLHSGLIGLSYALMPGLVIDLGNPDDFPAFYEMDNLFDEGHLNQEGAAQFTEALANAYEKRSRSRAAPRN